MRTLGYCQTAFQRGGTDDEANDVTMDVRHYRWQQGLNCIIELLLERGKDVEATTGNTKQLYSWRHLVYIRKSNYY